jgi:MscS family membrane protein
MVRHPIGETRGAGFWRRRPGARPWSGCGWRCVRVVVAAAILTTPAAAQIPGASSAPPTASPETVDPLGRTTPRGTIAGFIAAEHSRKSGTADAFMQITERHRSDADALARDLAAVLDRYFTQTVSTISDAPAGVTNDGLPLDREALPLSIEGERTDVMLVRVTDPEAGRIWLISSDTLDRVPSMRESVQSTWVERGLPQSLVRRTVFGISLGIWIVWVASIGGPLFVAWLLSMLILALVTRQARQRETLFKRWARAMRWPVTTVVALGAHLLLMPLIGFSLSFRLAYRRFALVVVVFAVAWLAWRSITATYDFALVIVERRGEANVRSLMLLVARVAKVIIVLVAIFALLTLVGVDTTTALAGVGLGGIAVALGAQKSVENLLGGVFLVTDQVLAVGDTCAISGRVGVIEDITLRSVRLRTNEQSLLSIPAGALSQSNIENFATRRKILVQTLLRLSYGTTAAQLDAVLAQLRTMLLEQPDVEAGTSRARLVNLGTQAIEIELFAFIETADYATFLAGRERLLLKATAIVEAAGTGFARPIDLLRAEPVEA